MKEITPFQLVQLQQNNDFFVVDFFSTTCAPCRAMEPHLKKIDHDDVEVFKLDVGKHYSVVEQLRITAVPTIMVFVDGREAARQVGTATLKELQKMVRQFT